mmetsp:Transcript_26175/g.55074  ORF Transcript_26175/g.55074 Transcript_26175/m.55074 type:complete len:83 (-) Transcript_26175:1431-1679(-)
MLLGPRTDMLIEISKALSERSSPKGVNRDSGVMRMNDDDDDSFNLETLPASRRTHGIYPRSLGRPRTRTRTKPRESKNAIRR